jgi:hypothetical protein
MFDLSLSWQMIVLVSLCQASESLCIVATRTPDCA